MKHKLKEATTAGSSGKYKVPVVLSPQPWTKKQLGPFTDAVYSYNNAELAYEEADGDFKQSPEKRAEIERKTDQIAQVDAYLKKFYVGQNDEDGSNLAELGNPDEILSQLQGPLDESFIKEDLAVWFGTKKKPKGSKQPKGPWVNICRKENGKHPPCGRPEADSKGYPKCRAVHVASKMSPSQKRAACQQKRTAEKKDPKIGKGNKPTMTSYKPRKESIDSVIKSMLNEIYDSQRLYPVKEILSMIGGAPYEVKKIVSNLNAIPCKNSKGEKSMCYRIPEVLYVYFSGNY